MSVKEQEESIWSTILPNTDRSDRGSIRRCFEPTAHPELGFQGCRTMYEGFRRGAKLNPLGPCMGFRAVSTSGFATPFIYSSYSECLARVNAFAAGLETLRLLEPNDHGMHVLGLYMRNCMEWILAEHAVYTIGGTTLPVYDTLGPESVEFVLAETEAKSVVCTRAELDKLCKAKLSGTVPKFAVAIIVDGVIPETIEKAKQAGLEVVSYAKVEAVGAHRITTQGHKHSPPAPSDVATFCYTSGTTGNPKGALITHENMASAISGICSIVPALGADCTDRHLSYLPLAHIFERTIVANMLVGGASIAFYRGDPIYLIEDLQACRPTFIPVVPRVLNKIYDKIQVGIAAAGGFKKKLFDAAVAAKTRGLQQGHLTHGLYDRLIFNKIKKGLGLDHVRVMVSGSAPLSANVMMFFRCMMGVPVIEGYGQTEGTASATAGHPDDITTAGHVGGPTAAVEIVLMDVPDMGYLHTDTTHRGQPCCGRGEICIRGPTVFKGYYKNEAKTKETIDDEGWLHSGDIGLWRTDGALQIIDRKKNLFKLSQGEYVAPEKIENILQGSQLIAQAFVYGDSSHDSLVAIVVPDEEAVKAWQTAEVGLSDASFEQCCKSTQLKDAIMMEIQRVSEESSLQGFEKVKAIYVDHKLFSVENGLLTPTFKLKRPQARDMYEKEISDLYANMPISRSRL